MKAIRMHALGGPEVLVYEDVPTPEPSDGEVLIKVYAAGINPIDWNTRRSGGLLGRTGIQLPIILGWDMSGVIEKIGPSVTTFSPGQAIYGMVSFPRLGNAYAEYLTASVADIALKPESIDHVHAAAVPLAGLTAWQGLFEYAKLQSGQRILVLGAAGGVGHFVVQQAKWKGTSVIGTSSPRNSDYLREIGADEVIDYNTVQIEDVLRDVDVVFNAVSADVATRSLKTLKRGGILVSVAGQADAEVAQQLGVRAQNFLVRPEATQLAELAKLIDSGTIKPHVDSAFPLAEASKAHALGELGHTRGKLVLKVRD